MWHIFCAQLVKTNLYSFQLFTLCKDMTFSLITRFNSNRSQCYLHIKSNSDLILYSSNLNMWSHDIKWWHWERRDRLPVRIQQRKRESDGLTERYVAKKCWMDTTLNSKCDRLFFFKKFTPVHGLNIFHTCRVGSFVFKVFWT